MDQVTSTFQGFKAAIGGINKALKTVVSGRQLAPNIGQVIVTGGDVRPAVYQERQEFERRYSTFHQVIAQCMAHRDPMTGRDANGRVVQVAVHGDLQHFEEERVWWMPQDENLREWGWEAPTPVETEERRVTAHRFQVQIQLVNEWEEVQPAERRVATRHTSIMTSERHMVDAATMADQAYEDYDSLGILRAMRRLHANFADVPAEYRQDVLADLENMGSTASLWMNTPFGRGPNGVEFLVATRREARRRVRHEQADLAAELFGQAVAEAPHALALAAAYTE